MKELINLYKEESDKAFRSINTDNIYELYNIILEAYKNEKKVFACGNGGNVASVQNLVLDLNMHPFVTEDKSKRSGIRNKFHAISLCDSSAAITGMVNDIGFENIFSEQLKYQADEKDVLFAMSGSGNSKNIIEALKEGRKIGMINILITRNNDTKCEEYADLIFNSKIRNM